MQVANDLIHAPNKPGPDNVNHLCRLISIFYNNKKKLPAPEAPAVPPTLPPRPNDEESGTWWDSVGVHRCVRGLRMTGWR